MNKLIIASIFLLFLAGCSVNSTFVYKPSAPVVGAQKLPVKLAVLPFKDGTENFTKRGSIFAPEGLSYNLAKAGMSQTITALTPELWAKAFADDLAASGNFQAVRFNYTVAELIDEDFYIDGTLKKVTFSGTYVSPSEYALSLRAVRKSDNRLIWEKDVAKVWTLTNSVEKGVCGTFSIQCQIDAILADSNTVMQELFAEARIDLLHTLTVSSGNQSEAAQRSSSVTPLTTDSESVDAEIEKILNGK